MAIDSFAPGDEAVFEGGVAFELPKEPIRVLEGDFLVVPSNFFLKSTHHDLSQLHHGLIDRLAATLLLHLYFKAC